MKREEIEFTDEEIKSEMKLLVKGCKKERKALEKKLKDYDINLCINISDGVVSYDASIFLKISSNHNYGGHINLSFDKWPNGDFKSKSIEELKQKLIKYTEELE